MDAFSSIENVMEDSKAMFLQLQGETFLRRFQVPAL